MSDNNIPHKESQRTFEGEEDEESEVIRFLCGVVNAGKEAEMVVRPCKVI